MKDARIFFTSLFFLSGCVCLTIFSPHSVRAYSTFEAASQNQSLLAQKVSQQVAVTANTVYLDKFLEHLKKTNKTSNFSQIEAKVRQEAASTTDLTDLFLRQNNIRTRFGGAKKVSFGSFLDFFPSLFRPKEVFAETGLPFGGPMVFTFYCDCSDSWLVAIGPTSNPDTSDLVLDYIPESQIFASYNIPFTAYLLGFYEPGVPVCYVYAGYSCFDIESDGLISPETGSSPE